MKILIVGEAPSRMMHESGVHEPMPHARRELAYYAGLCLPEFNEKFECVNVLDRWPGKAGKGDDFPMKLAYDGAERVQAKVVEGDYARVILLGRRVEAAFGIQGNPWFEWFQFHIPCRIAPKVDVFRRDEDPFVLHECAMRIYKVMMVVTPHPSGVNMWWNDRRNKAQAARFWGEVAR